MTDLESLFEGASRQLARRTSRRGTLARLGKALVAGLVMPALPIDRVARHAVAADAAADQGCDYWKYCSVDGFLCSCCGGSSHECPPGTEASQVSWVGTCHNEKDGKNYLVSYNDCCGKTSCGRCACNANIGERPGYEMGIHNDVNWCMGNMSGTMYHCTTSIIVGTA